MDTCPYYETVQNFHIQYHPKSLYYFWFGTTVLSDLVQYQMEMDVCLELLYDMWWEVYEEIENFCFVDRGFRMYQRSHECGREYLSLCHEFPGEAIVNDDFEG
jgi:hypothetical protein